MRRTLSGLAAVVALATASTASGRMAATPCNRSLPARAEMACGEANLRHATDVLRFLAANPTLGRPLTRARIRRDHDWLRSFALARIAEARARLAPAVPSGFLAAALCVHGREGAWTDDTGNGFGGGLQFTIGTWNEAADHSGGRIPRVGSTGEIAAMAPSTQIAAAAIIVARRGGRWSDWPNTARACGLPT